MAANDPELLKLIDSLEATLVQLRQRLVADAAPRPMPPRVPSRMRPAVVASFEGPNLQAFADNALRSRDA